MRLERAIEAIRESAAAASDMPLDSIGRDDDMRDDIGMDEIELESLALILEEIFAIQISPGLWGSPIYRSAAGLAEWCIRKSEEAAWQESQRQRRHA